MCVQKGFNRKMELLYSKLFLYVFTSGTFWITDSQTQLGWFLYRCLCFNKIHPVSHLVALPGHELLVNR